MVTTTSTSPVELNSAVSGAVQTAKDVITDNMPLVFGVAIAFVAWSVGRRVLGKI